jgi:hypothetical protein
MVIGFIAKELSSFLLDDTLVNLLLKHYYRNTFYQYLLSLNQVQTDLLTAHNNINKSSLSKDNNNINNRNETHSFA